MNNKIFCIYCNNNVKHNYYKKHIQTKKHRKNKYTIIDSCLQQLPSEITNLIFEFYTDSFYEQNVINQYYNYPLIILRDEKDNEIIGNYITKPIPWYKKLFKTLFPFL